MGVIADKIRRAIFGGEVRDSIADGIEVVEQLREDYDNQVINAGNSNAEIVDARGGQTKLKDRLDNFDEQLDNKANDNEVVKKGQVDLDEMTERTLQAIQGGEGTSFNLLSVPRDYSVTPIKTDFIELGKNLFNRNKVIDGCYLNYRNGEYISNELWFVTDYISVMPGETYTITEGGFLCYYDEKKVYKSGINENVTQITVPEECYFIRFSSTYEKINVVQIEKGEEKTGYEEYKLSFNSKISAKNIDFKDNKIKPRETTFFEISKNLFDKNKIISGVYIQGSTGNLVDNLGYFTSDFIELEYNETYSINIASFYCLYNKNKERIGGNNGTISKYTCGQNVKYIRVSNLLADIDKFQVEKGTESTSYQEYDEGKIPYKYIQQIPEKPIKLTSIIVKINGDVGTDCDFTDIKSALDSIQDNSYYNRYQIIVKNGIYDISNLNVNYLGFKHYVDIIGQSRSGVKVIHNSTTNDASKAGFDVQYYGEFNGECKISNMTVQTYNCKSPFHFDTGEGQFQGTITVENCDLINLNEKGKVNYHNLIACGLGVGQNIIVRNCKGVGFIWAHNHKIDNLNGGAKFIVENCICEYLWVASLGSLTKDECTFKNNKCNYIYLMYADYLKRHGTNNVEMSWDITLEDNKFDYLKASYETDNGQNLGDFWQNVYGGKYSVTDSSIHDYCCNQSGQVITKGSYVKIVDDITKAIVIADKENAYGIALENIENNSYGVIQYRGNFEKALANI